MRSDEAENRILIRRFQDLAGMAEQRNIVTHTDFLNLAEQSLFFEQAASEIHLPYTAEGGYPEAERRIILFGSEASNMPISLIQIQRENVRFTDAPAHRDYLGALLHLGIKRELIGDILPEADGRGVCVFCMAHICDYLCENLRTVRHDTVVCRQISQLPEKYACQKTTDTVTAASERLDAVVAAVWHLSRGQSCAYFSEGKVFVNGRRIVSGSGKVAPGEIISVRGLGRFQYMGAAGITKKGRCRIEIMRYR